MSATQELHELGQSIWLDNVGTPMPTDGGDSEAVLAEFRRSGVDVDRLAARLQSDRREELCRLMERPDGPHRPAERGAQRLIYSTREETDDNHRDDRSRTPA